MTYRTACLSTAIGHFKKWTFLLQYALMQFVT